MIYSMSQGWRDLPGGRFARPGLGPVRWALVLFAALVAGGCGKPSYEECIRSGLDEYNSKRYAEAVAQFEAAAGYDRERPEPTYYTARCYHRMAEEEFAKDNLGNALRLCDRAIYYYDMAIGAFPGFTRAVQGKANALKLKGLPEAAKDIANWATRVSGPQAKKLILKGHLLVQSGDMDGAQLAFQQAASVEPENAAAHAELGLFYMRCHNDALALESLRRAQRLNPNAPGVARAIAHLESYSRAEP